MRIGGVGCGNGSGAEVILGYVPLAVKRIMQEARELANDPSTDYSAAPLEVRISVAIGTGIGADCARRMIYLYVRAYSLYLSAGRWSLICCWKEWHCTMRGPKDTEFEGGIYHFRILLPAEYPFRPPSVMMLTPSGRFELNTKVSMIHLAVGKYADIVILICYGRRTRTRCAPKRTQSEIFVHKLRRNVVLTTLFLVMSQICISFTSCAYYILKRHVDRSQVVLTPMQITKNYGNQLGACGPVRASINKGSNIHAQAACLISYHRATGVLPAAWHGCRRCRFAGDDRCRTEATGGTVRATPVPLRSNRI